ncbi:MAG: hypothetical protein EHM77_02825 [Planctomycetaceae bacterium]|nr:MAG: hypothetical protein EHM77_02825 [Planctomycetaceae bacterium]
MQTQSIQSELLDFLQFASSRVASGDDRLSIEELVRQWRQTSEFAQTVADVRQGITDAAQGKAQPISDAFADVRRKLGIAD